MRLGLTILTDLPWAEAAPRWRAAEEMGFDHAWTYDHLVWGGLPESPWTGALPTLAAVAATTSRIRLGTLVAAPNFRHPYPFLRDVQALEGIADGRVLLGLGVGGDRDAHVLGAEELSTGERVDRFQEFVTLLARLRDEDHVDADGRWFATRDARTLPPLRRTPFLVAANGPRSLRFSARVGDGWVTTGPAGATTMPDWYAGLARSRDTYEEALVAAGRDPAELPRYLLADTDKARWDVGGFALSSVGAFEETVGRAAELGFTDVVTHWPRPDQPYAGDEQVLEQVAADVLPRLRG
ncbi:F420-dependent glucose-6-phosphate dehydrogenase [Nocardioides dokdonensis FR1436]|uniref:F420-dependent glucose-6-phosphate dehydrogenase n=1 Tax=Nocardioides dokdonensis FR1436 TaxID=1300347 RepID=A0A1A9GHI7_9ACTN|nr:LLM class flavin-dependent oxidoreductase [Nocardioides dokdonensis]ANH37789.1 F420-dependent glucose-6-phosphate dehydrogenase [Nocardioides dokdonensis FR1436]